MKLLLERIIDDKQQTLGRLFVLDGNNSVLYNCHTMELPWKHNQKRISCIPTGTFETIKHRSRRFGASFWVLNVPYRSEILIHYGNYNKNTLGCILPGKDLKDLNRDGLLDVTESRTVMSDLLELMPKKFELEIIKNQNFIEL